MYELNHTWKSCFCTFNYGVNLIFRIELEMFKLFSRNLSNQVNENKKFYFSS